MKRLWYKFSKLKTWQKIGIGIGILTIFKYLCMGYVIPEVKAESYDDPYIYVVSPSTGLAIPPSQMSVKEPFISNYISQSDINAMVNGNTNDTKLYTQFDYLRVASDNSYDWVSTQAYIDNTTTFNLSNNNSQIYYVYDIKFVLRQPKFEAIKGSDYSILLGIYGDGLEWNSNLDPSQTNLVFKYCDNNYTCTNANGMVDYDIYFINGENNNSYNNPLISYIKIDYKLNNTFPNGNYTIYLDSIDFDTTGSGNNFNESTYNWLLKNSGYNETTIIKVDCYYNIMDARIQISDNPNEYEFDGNLITNQQYENCDPLDIACHVRNIQRGIENFGKNILYSIKSLFSYIFIPKWDAIEEKIDIMQQSIAYKYPDIQAAEDYLVYCRDRFMQVSRQTTISFPGVKWPFDNSNTYVIEPFTYDFATIINDNRIGPYYLIGRYVLIGIIIIWWGIYLINWLKSILHNTPKIEM